MKSGDLPALILQELISKNRRERGYIECGLLTEEN